MKEGTPQAIYLKDYRPPPFWIDAVELRFELHEDVTRVQSRLELRRNQAVGNQPLVLDGQELALQSVRVDGRSLGTGDYVVTADNLIIDHLPDRAVVEIETRIKPQDNTSLEGLYRSGGNYCTQCEAEGFRKITYYLDRPDVMARFTTTVVADRNRYPVLLSNGNPVKRGELEGGRHFVTWEDPFPKPCYLFALVAGDLACVRDTFATCSGRTVALEIYVEPRNRDKCGHAMLSLKKAMRWDEETFGREYDLDIYMVVAVDDFNMGAMENKGLNIFNSRYVLARPDTATDEDYEGIEGVIGHEYFHNWSGNRVTCRDWFQLSLKEGFTVFRDEQFTADMTSKAVKRIKDVNVLRTFQFREDGGPLAHPVRPDSYVEINNFYTLTVYNKGAEVVRMLHTLLGAEGFRRGTDLYFRRHDGQAVTTDDFVRAMEDANGADLSQFRRWYSQAGTPEIRVAAEYDPKGRTYRIELRQSTAATPGQPEKFPFHIPVAIGLLGSEGEEIPLQLEGEPKPHTSATRVLELREPSQHYTFVNVSARPTPSLLRGFSAPVKLKLDLTDADLAFLAAHDTDEFNRWDAGQRLAQRVIERLVGEVQAGTPLHLEPGIIDAFRKTLENPRIDRRLAAQALVLPSETYIAEEAVVVDPEAIHAARLFVRTRLAESLRDLLLQVYTDNDDPGPYRVDGEAVGRRQLKNACLGYLMELEDPRYEELCENQFRRGGNMTDVIAALGAISNTESPRRTPMLDAFFERWQHDPLVVDKWFAIQATSRRAETLTEVRRLADHPSFTLRNPNRVRALVGAFCGGNPVRFHDPSGAGYRFLTGYVERLDRLNPQIAARMVTPLTQWRKYEATRAALMHTCLEDILALPGLSRDVYEVTAKSLQKS